MQTCDFEALVCCWNFELPQEIKRKECTLCYAIVVPGQKLAFRAGFWPDCYREGTEIGSPAGLRLAGGPISVLSR